MAGVLLNVFYSSSRLCLTWQRLRCIRTSVSHISIFSHFRTSHTTKDKPTVKSSGLAHQYQSIKKSFPDFIVLFQVGDFYEIYSDDAMKVAEKTSLRISKNPNVNRLMAGFPIRSLDSWLTTLVQQGFQLAICPQIPEKTPKASRLIHRDVVRLVTPGTLLEPLQPDANYLLSITKGPGTSVGMAWMDISTGDFQMGTSSIEDLEQDISRVNPAEILMAENDFKEPRIPDNYKIGRERKKSTLDFIQDYHLTMVPSDWFSPDDVTDDVTTENSKFSRLEMCAGRALLRYVSYTQREVTPLLNQPIRYNHETYMAIDVNTRRSLELTKPLMSVNQKASLFGVMNDTSTSAGRRLLYQRICAPSNELDVIQTRLDAVDCFYQNRHVAEIVHKELRRCSDVERRLQKVATGSAELSDLRSIHNTILLYSEILRLLESLSGETPAISALLVDDFEDLRDLQAELDQAVGELTSKHSVMEGYSDAADDIRDRIAQNEQEVTALRDVYRSALGIPRLVINNHRSFIRVVEIPSSQATKLASRDDFVKVDSTSDKTRYSTLRLQELNAELKSLQDDHDRVQRALSEDLCQQVTHRADHIKRVAKSLAELDVASSLALLAITRGYTKPNMAEDNEFDVRGGRHPVVDILQPDSFVCNDCNLNDKNLWIVTGPNMGGKSTFLRQNALISILAQAGSFVPAQHATLGIVDRVFARIGASDNLVQHQSTFMAEMLETAYILSHATQNSLVVIDEIGRGTSMLDGLAIAWAVIEYIHDVIGCRTLASTHFHQLAQLSSSLQRVASYHVTAHHSSEHGIIFTFKVISGIDSKSFGIDVARLAGIPVEVETRARELLVPLEKKADFISPA